MLLAISSSIATADFTTGLVAYYPFNRSANDASGNSNNGEVHEATLTTDMFGNLNSAYSFNGTNSYILIGDPVPSVLQIQNEITLSAWIYASSYGSDIGLIVGSQCDRCTAGAAGATIFLDSRTNPDGLSSPSGHIHFQIGNGNWHHSNSQTRVPLNQWVHIVATRTANEDSRIYYNGVLQPVIGLPWSGTISYTGTWFAIGRQKDLGRYFKGSIDNVRIYNRALSELEIQQLYQEDVNQSQPSSGIGGSVTNTNLATVNCKNITTGQIVKITRLKGATSWDCTKAGLLTRTGDIVKGTYTGTVR